MSTEKKRALCGKFRFSGIRKSTGEEIVSDSIGNTKVCDELHVFFKNPYEGGRVWIPVVPESVKQIK